MVQPKSASPKINPSWLGWPCERQWEGGASPGCKIPAEDSPARAQPLPWVVPHWKCHWLWSGSSLAAQTWTKQWGNSNRIGSRRYSTRPLMSIWFRLLLRVYWSDQPGKFCHEIPFKNIFTTCILPVFQSYRVLVVLVVEVKRRQEGLKLIENLIVLCHVSGQNASAIITHTTY